MTLDDSLTAAAAQPHQVFLPGCFVVLQGIAGDGLANTIESDLPEDCCIDMDDEEEEDGDDSQEEKEEEEPAAAVDEVPPLEEDHFHPNTRHPTTATAAAAATAAEKAKEEAKMPASRGPFLSNGRMGGLLASQLSRNAFALNNPTSFSTATRNMDPPAASTANTKANNANANAIDPPATNIDPAGAVRLVREPSSASSPAPQQEDSFVVIGSEPNTPTRIHMYAQKTNPMIHNNNTSMATPATTTQRNSNSNANQRKQKKDALLAQWSQDVWERQRMQRREWLMQQRQHCDPHSTTTTTPQHSHAAASPATCDDDWWLDSESGHLAIVEHLPQLSHQQVITTGATLGVLPPGSTVMAQKLYTLDSETLQIIHVDHGNDDDSDDIHNDDDPNNNGPLAPSIGCIQVLQVQFSSSSVSSPPTSPTAPELEARDMVSPNDDTDHNNNDAGDDHDEQAQPSVITTPTILTTGYCVYSVHGYPLLVPGIPTLYMNPQTWWWRVTCRVGAFLRLGLELNSDHLVTIPFGTFVQVTRKTVNQQGLSRLRVVVQNDNTSDGKQPPPRQVEGWCSEFLNPLSGQRGHVVQSLPFPVPALYKVTLPQGAVIREQVELSSRQIGHAPCGTILSIVQRQFSEHPQDQCIERLKLAGGRETGWISARLNQLPPDDKCIVELMGVDPRFDPYHPGEFHWQVLKEEEDNLRQQHLLDPQGRAIGNDNDSGGVDELSSVDEEGISSSSSPEEQKARPKSKGRNSSNGGVNGIKKSRKQEMEKCLICLTEERNATIVHGETGHIACCLVCARILKARGDRVRRAVDKMNAKRV